MQESKKQGTPFSRALCALTNSATSCPQYGLPAAAKGAQYEGQFVNAKLAGLKTADCPSTPGPLTEVDDRGYIYMFDHVDTGMHLLELVGNAKRSCRDRN
jgi:hypothetical protein